MTMDKEMMKALQADGEKLKAMTGEDHGPVFFDEAAKSTAARTLSTSKRKLAAPKKSGKLSRSAISKAVRSVTRKSK